MGDINQEPLSEQPVDESPVQRPADSASETPALRRKPGSLSLAWDILLIGVLILGAYFRFVGIDWDENQHLHPDERFMTMVSSGITSEGNEGRYFNTDLSTLNPNNRGYGFYVYGTLPLFMVRITAELLEQTGYGEIYLVGRQLSGFMDLLTILLVYFIANRLYHKPRLSLLAASFTAFAVLQIQLSHYWTTDTFSNTFAILAIYFAVRILPEDGKPAGPTSKPGADWFEGLWSHWGTLVPYALFGIALGWAVASKVNAAPLALILPAAALISYLKLDAKQRELLAATYIRNLVLAGILFLLTFRIFQPYAFTGPTFFHVLPNPKWIETMKSLAAQSSGDVDFPPALQWARRPIWFSGQNMVVWGLGLPLGLLSIAGFLWMGRRVFIKGEWHKHSLLWGWTGLYFIWQSTNLSRTMRYQLLIYPTLAIIAAWAVFTLWEKGKQRGSIWLKTAAALTGTLVLLGTFAYAYAFTRIYTRPMTRVEASRWIFENIPGPLTLAFETEDGAHNQPLGYQIGSELRSEDPFLIAFTAKETGLLTKLTFDHIRDRVRYDQMKVMIVTLRDGADPETVLASAVIEDTFAEDGSDRGRSFDFVLQPQVELQAGKTYYFSYEINTTGQILELIGQMRMSVATPDGVRKQALPDPMKTLTVNDSFEQIFSANFSGELKAVNVRRIVDWENLPDQKTLRLSILGMDQNVVGPLAVAEVTSSFQAVNDIKGEMVRFAFDSPPVLNAEEMYVLRIEVVNGPGRLAIYGNVPVNESSWDDVLPISLGGYNPYDYYSGIYRSDLNFEMYWDDNEDKLDRFLNNLDNGDYIFISSNRQWGTTTRVPERYPLTTQFYRSLLGCPEDENILYCYRVAEPGMYQGELGFELINVFQSDPNLGGLRFNTQFAEEAFTVYDHPKVLIFQKAADYDSAKTREILESVDLSQVVRVIPGKAKSFPANLLLPTDRLAEQQAGGTWAELFDRDGLLNKYPLVGLVVWYLVITLLGWMNYPLVRLALRGLPDKGFPLTKMAGMMLLAWMVWVAGSARIPFVPLTISAAALLLLAVNAALAWVQRTELRQELRERSRYFLWIELIGLILFVIFLLVRLGNPDLWHPYKGGEKPMDFSYFNAVLKSTTFPPYDPWFAGGYLNYYYYGFVVAGVPVKWLGIVPAVAYNLILPTFFSLVGLGAYSVAWNLIRAGRKPAAEGEAESAAPHWMAWMGSILLAVLGNLGSLRMIWHGIMRLAAPGGTVADSNIFQKLGWTVAGVGQLFKGAGLPYGAGNWYWDPSRVYPGSAITEFPAFTFLYADPHAHLFALPVTILALAWALSITLKGWEWGLEHGRGKALHFIVTFLLGGLVIGALKPMNTWDLPTYLALGGVATLFAAIRGAVAKQESWVKGLAWGALSALLLVGLALLMYEPFSAWFGQGYDKVKFWHDEPSPFWSYITHWGVFLFFIASWMLWETREWMATTPVSSLNKLMKFRELILFLLGVLVLALVGLAYLKVQIGWMALPLMAWAGTLLLRPKMPAAKRAVLFLVGTAMALSLFVELFHLEGDLGRMNTVFKLYMQAWTLLSLSAAAALAWVLPAGQKEWPVARRGVGQTLAVGLIFSAALFPLLGGADKIKDRYSDAAPHTLDGMAYMPYATYGENGTDMSLAEDYVAIQWMQENVPGSPVIVEGHVTEYRWGSRYTIYTGLPGVVGWNWHQRQQRALTPSEWVFGRVEQIGNFYNSIERSLTTDFLARYDVKYIVVGVMEHAIYTPEGLAKFEAWDGDLWDEVFRTGQTVIYQVR